FLQKKSVIQTGRGPAHGPAPERFRGSATTRRRCRETLCPSSAAGDLDGHCGRRALRKDLVGDLAPALFCNALIHCAVRLLDIVLDLQGAVGETDFLVRSLVAWAVPPDLGCEDRAKGVGQEWFAGAVWVSAGFPHRQGHLFVV